MSMDKNGFGQCGDGTLKLTVFGEWTDGVNWFFECWYVITKIKIWSKFFWLGMVKNDCDQWTLKLTLSQERTDGTNWFFCMLAQFYTN